MLCDNLQQNVPIASTVLQQSRLQYSFFLQVSDKLRDLLLNPDSSSADIYTPTERKELLFCMFEHLCLGGAVNQFEVNLRLHDLCDCVGCSILAQEVQRANHVAHVH